MSVLSPPWPAQPWNGHGAASFSALAAPVIPPIYDDDSPFPSPTQDHSAFSALAASPPRRTTHPQVTHRHQSPVPGPSAFGGVPPRNTRSLDRDALVQILNFLSNLLPARFGNGQQIRLVIHGGAVMLLNKDLAALAAHTAATDGRVQQRTTTRDIDYIARSFSSEWAQRYGVYDANERLKQCCFDTALQFGLGADWMNSDADVALPMATDPKTGSVYDPIHAASIQAGDALTVYTSPNGRLKLVSVTPFWTVALKMVRYNAADRGDICILLRSGTHQRQLHWTPTKLELWLLGTCWAMGYSGYDAERIREMRRRMVEVVEEANRWDPDAVADDGRGGFVPLYPKGGGAYPHGYGPGYQQGRSYMQQPPGYGYPPDPRMGSPFHSPAHSPCANTFPPSASPGFGNAGFDPNQFTLGPAPTPPPPPPPKKKHKKKKSQSQSQTSVAPWPNQWTHSPPTQSWDPAGSSSPRWDAEGSSPPRWEAQDASPRWDAQNDSPRWDPESTAQWDEDVCRDAAKAKKQGYGRMTSWIPFLKNSKSQPALKSKSKKTKKDRRRYDSDDTDTDSDASGSDTDSDAEDLRREKERWAARGASMTEISGTGSEMGGGRASFQHNVADFMSNGMTPIAAPSVLASGAGPGRLGQVLPGWNVPGAPVPGWNGAQAISPPPGWSGPQAISPPPGWSGAQAISPPPGWNRAQAVSPPPGWNGAQTVSPPPRWNGAQPYSQSHTPQPQWAGAQSQSQATQSWLYAGQRLERQRSPPEHRQMQMQAQQGPDMNQVASEMNALGLSGV